MRTNLKVDTFDFREELIYTANSKESASQLERKKKQEALELPIKSMAWHTRLMTKPSKLLLLKFESNHGNSDSPPFSQHYEDEVGLEPKSPSEFGSPKPNVSPLEKATGAKFTVNSGSENPCIYPKLANLPSDSSKPTFNEEFYLRIEQFLDSEGFLSVIPEEEHRVKKFARVITNHCLESSQSDSTMYASSPLLSGVNSSSLIARRQNSPLLSCSSPLVQQKSNTMVLSLSRFGKRAETQEEVKTSTKLNDQEEGQSTTIEKSLEVFHLPLSLGKLQKIPEDLQPIEGHSPITSHNNIC